MAALLQGWANSQQAVGLFDEQDRLQYVNVVYREIFLGGQEGAFTLSDLLRYGFKNRTGTVIESGDVEAFITDLYTRRRKVGPHQAFETDLMDGRWFFMNQTVLPNGWVLIVGTDITALKHNEKTLRQEAETDPLTGLANRRRMFGLLDRALAGLATEPLCLALVDIDRFKGINDRFGHPAGDAVLKHFADLARHRLGDAGSFGRLVVRSSCCSCPAWTSAGRKDCFTGSARTSRPCRSAAAGRPSFTRSAPGLPRRPPRTALRRLCSGRIRRFISPRRPDATGSRP
ncbi:diguanylate cyclase [Microvirga terrae]|uniref:diguanylate cyclase n=1 Tax=Microvirga terrae TaxID=2740529 RepID=A0ABY5RNC1_9HYPH|nr:sensor domain-containing diguanylate cyclase [Microvirga terrae]UVF18458.1 diguanylate cyclase [Microvirga terrae]